MTPRLPLLATIPAALFADLRGHRVRQVGFATGTPTGTRRVAEALSFVDALRWLERHRAAMRLGHVELEDRRVLLFRPDGFWRVR